MEPLVKNSASSANAEERSINEAARRCLNLFFVLFVSEEPPTTTRIIGDSDLGYGSPNTDSEKKKFKRDRNRLEEAGIHLHEISSENKTEESAWEIDWDHTGINLDQLERDELEDLLYASRTCDSISFWTDIHALHDLQSKLMAALARKGCGNLPEPVEEGSTPREGTLGTDERWVAALWGSFRDRTSVRFSYTNASDEDHTHVVDIYGFFTLGGRTYFAGFTHGIERILTYRADRIRSLEQLKETYEVPDSFVLGEYVFLPFDFSSNEPVEAVFSFPGEGSEYEIAALTRGRGELDLDAKKDVWTWTVEVRDLDAAASLALANGHLGMRPVSPPPLTDIWTDKIERAVTSHEPT